MPAECIDRTILALRQMLMAAASSREPWSVHSTFERSIKFKAVAS